MVWSYSVNSYNANDSKHIRATVYGVYTVYGVIRNSEFPIKFM